MMEITATIDSLSRLAADTAIASVWEGLLLASVVWVALKFMPRLSASLRFTVWGTAFLAIVALPFLSLGHTAAMGGIEASGSVPAVAAHPLLHLDTRWALAMMAVWILMSMVRAIDLGRAAMKLHALWSRSTSLDDVDPAMRLLLRTGRFSRQVQLATTTDLDQPCVIGFFRPRILVPAWLHEQATPAELRHIVLHETAHLRRFDDWTNLLQKLALVFFPLNPALYWIGSRLCFEREEACDESVIHQTQAPREYATCLANLAQARLERRSGRNAEALALGAWERRSTLALRIHNILRGNAHIDSAKARLVLTVMVAASVFGTVELGRAGQLVEFADPVVSPALASASESVAPAARSEFRNVVYREPVGSRSLSSALSSDSTAQVRASSAGVTKTPAIASKTASKKPGSRPAYRASLPQPGINSWIVVTRWQDANGQQTTIVNRVFRISAIPVGPSSSGWYVVQL